jgi:hypothetical protein
MNVDEMSLDEIALDEMSLCQQFFLPTVSISILRSNPFHRELSLARITSLLSGASQCVPQTDARKDLFPE